MGHVDHGLRGAESEADAAFVWDLAEALGLPFSIRQLHLDAEKSGSEGAARDQRFAALGAMAQDHGCGAIVLAHHAGDQAETVLLRLLRGCGPQGLGAIRSRSRVGDCLLLRPLLHIPRASLLEYLATTGQTFRTDSTNQLPMYLRNKVRLQTLPALRELNPEIDAALVRMARHAAEANDAIAQIGRALALEARRANGRGGYDREVLRAAPIAALRWLLHKVIRGRTVKHADAMSASQLDRAVELVRGRRVAGQLEFAGGRRLVVTRAVVRVTGAGEAAPVKEDS